MLTPIACDDCGRSFMTAHPDTMLMALAGPCRCGGRFQAVAASEPGPASPAYRAHDLPGAAGSDASLPR